LPSSFRNRNRWNILCTAGRLEATNEFKPFFLRGRLPLKIKEQKKKKKKKKKKGKAHKRSAESRLICCLEAFLLLFRDWRLIVLAAGGVCSSLEHQLQQDKRRNVNDEGEIIKA
jgi:hypothetical protein